MDETKLRFLFVFTDLIAPLIVGYVLNRRGIINRALCDKLVKINIRVVISALSFLSFWTLKISLDLLWLPVFGIFAIIIPGLIAQFTFARTYTDYNDRGAYMMASMISNIGTLTGLCAFIIYGIQGFAYIQIVAMFQALFTFAYCFPLAAYYHSKAASKSFDRARPAILPLIFNRNQIPVLTMLIGFGFSLYNMPVPQICYDAFNALVHVGAWAGMLPVGCMIKFDRAGRYLKRTCDISVVKFIILPVIAYFIVINLFTDPVLIGSMVLAFSAPTAINAVLASSIFKLNVDIAVSSFLSTTVLFLFVIFPLYFFVIKDLIIP